MAFLLHLNVIVFFFVLAKALSLDAPFYFFLIIVPLVHVMLMFPISINGIGVRENALIFFLSQINISPENAIALSWISYGLVLVYALFGGLIYAFKK